MNKKENKLTKGSGFHLDLFILGCLACFNGLFGFPWVWAATVRSVTHVGALSIFSKSNAPGERPRLEGIREQRVTAFLVNAMIGECFVWSSVGSSYMDYDPLCEGMGEPLNVWTMLLAYMLGEIVCVKRRDCMPLGILCEEERMCPEWDLLCEAYTCRDPRWEEKRLHASLDPLYEETVLKVGFFAWGVCWDPLCKEKRFPAALKEIMWSSNPLLWWECLIICEKRLLASLWPCL